MCCVNKDTCRLVDGRECRKSGRVGFVPKGLKVGVELPIPSLSDKFMTI